MVSQQRLRNLSESYWAQPSFLAGLVRDNTLSSPETMAEESKSHRGHIRAKNRTGNQSISENVWCGTTIKKSWQKWEKLNLQQCTSHIKTALFSVEINAIAND